MPYLRVWSFLLVLSLGALSFSINLQQHTGYAPCALCIIQRYGFAIIVAAAVPGIFGLWGRAFAVLGLVAAIGGAIAAAFHVYILANPATHCGPEPLAEWLNSLPPAEWLPELFQVSGLCGQELPSFLGLGLGLPSWSLLLFCCAILSLTCIFVMPERRGLFRKG